MAGMLPGVEAARRRRVRNTNTNQSRSSDHQNPAISATRRLSFCLYAAGHDFLPSSSSTPGNMIERRDLCDESRLDAAAREAKKRLDQRLQPQWKSQAKREFQSYQADTLSIRPTIQVQVPELKKSESKKLNWSRLSWRSSEQEECAVCLEKFRTADGGTLMQLPCRHRFHGHCLVPWLEDKDKPHCPCCRIEVSKNEGVVL